MLFELGQEFHTRKTYYENGFRSDMCVPKETILDMFCKLNKSIVPIENVEFNLEYKDKGRICVSEEMGFVHVMFEPNQFLDEEAEGLIKDFCEYYSDNYSEEIESYKSN